MNAKFVDILLVEDNQGDIVLTKEALCESKIKNDLHVVTDGVEALDFLYKRGAYVNAVTPDFILLDLNLPKKDGREVLSEIKTDQNLKRIPVVVLTASEAEEDIIKSYDSYANCYIRKPIDFNKFTDVVRTIENFWFSIVKLPEMH